MNFFSDILPQETAICSADILLNICYVCQVLDVARGDQTCLVRQEELLLSLNLRQSQGRLSV